MENVVIKGNKMLKLKLRTQVLASIGWLINLKSPVKAKAMSTLANILCVQRSLPIFIVYTPDATGQDFLDIK